MLKFARTLMLVMLMMGAGGLVHGGESLSCLDGRAQSLKNGGFSGPIVCAGSDARFRRVGTIRTSDGTLTVYDYRYRYTPTDGAVMHGGQRLVIFSSRGQYLGQYALSPPPNLDVNVIGQTIEVRARGELKGTIDFSSGPPTNVLLDGEVVVLFK
jgi:hypothetical protein